MSPGAPTTGQRITAIRAHLIQAGPLGVSGGAADGKHSVNTGTRDRLLVTVEAAVPD
jgi:hypothetical protein